MKKICTCGHEEVCHVDLMGAINKMHKKGKTNIEYIPCIINGCVCKKFKEDYKLRQRINRTIRK